MSRFKESLIASKIKLLNRDNLYDSLFYKYPRGFCGAATKKGLLGIYQIDYLSRIILITMNQWNLCMTNFTISENIEYLV